MDLLSTPLCLVEMKKKKRDRKKEKKGKKHNSVIAKIRLFEQF